MKRSAVLLAALAAALAAQTARARPQHEVQDNPYDRQVVFDPPLAAPTYYGSSGVVVAPSQLELIGGRVPLDSTHFVTPPTALRLRWTSASGGDWNANIGTPAHWDGLLEHYSGSVLSLWCFSPDGLSLEAAPHLYLKDVDGFGTSTISLLREALPAGRWVHLRLPLDSFRSQYGSTDVERFNRQCVDQLVFVQGLDDGAAHTLYVDDIQIVADGPPILANAPRGLTAEPGERHVQLAWDAASSSHVMRYRIERSIGGGPWLEVGTQSAAFHEYCDFVAGPNVAASYRVRAESPTGDRSPPSEAVSATTRSMDDDALLTMAQKGCFEYYWKNGHPRAGMAIELTPGDPNLVALGSSGFGVMAILVGAERGFVTRKQATERLLKITRFLQKADRYHGAWSHYLDGRTGKTIPYFGPYDDGGDLVETAFLMQGLLAARQYFDRDDPLERTVRNNITGLWRGVEWDWYRRKPDSPFIYWHWSPDHAWHIGHPLIGWNETMIVYLLAIASPTHAVPPSMYYSGWASQDAVAVDYRRG